MRISATLATFLLCTVLVPAAWADDDARTMQDYQQLERDLAAVAVAPDPGRDTAPVRSPPWCDGLKLEGSWSPSAIGRSIQQAQRDGWTGYLEAAQITCHFPKAAPVQKAVAIIEQAWINITGLSEAQALETFKARLAADKLKADKEKLCDALSISEEVEGEERAFMTARRVLFGCVQKGWADKQPVWADSGEHVPDDLVGFVDASSVEPDPLVRLALVVDHLRFVWGAHNDYFDKTLVAAYVPDQVDYQALSVPATMKVLDAAPYQGNSYARTVVLESLGRAKLGIGLVEDEVKKKTNDADWKELLVTAPQRGVADWTKEMTRWKDAFARSNAFEHVFWGPSRRASKGCWPALYKDFVAVAKTLKHGSFVEFKESLSDPIASLLYSRLSACAAIDLDKNYAAQLLNISRDTRAARGPRLAAYYAALDALGKIRDDRTKFPIQPADFWFMKSRALYTRAYDVVSRGKQGMGFVGDGGKGVVKSAAHGPKGVVVQFETQKHTEMGRSCVETNHILTFRGDGSPIYYQKCHETGLITVNDTPGGITIPNDWAGGVAVGSALEFDAGIGPAPARMGLPKAVYSDKAKKKLVNFYGIGL